MTPIATIMNDTSAVRRYHNHFNTFLLVMAFLAIFATYQIQEWRYVNYNNVLHAIVNASREGAFPCLIVDSDFTIVHNNTKATKGLGYTDKLELRDKSALELIPEQYQGRHYTIKKMIRKPGVGQVSIRDCYMIGAYRKKYYVKNLKILHATVGESTVYVVTWEFDKK